jgi:hypothetical protein
MIRGWNTIRETEKPSLPLKSWLDLRKPEDRTYAASQPLHQQTPFGLSDDRVEPA